MRLVSFSSLVRTLPSEGCWTMLLILISVSTSGTGDLVILGMTRPGANCASPVLPPKIIADVLSEQWG